MKGFHHRVFRPLRTLAVALLVGLQATGPVTAQVARVVTADFAPLTDNSSADRKGLLHDLVREMMTLQGVDKPIEFMAWPAAVAEADSKPGTLFFPVTRSKEREDKYLWLTKIFDMDRAFAGRPGSVPISTVEEARRLKAVGTTVNSASLTFLKQKGLTNTVEFANSRDLMRGLLEGKVDAAYQPMPFCKADWKMVGGQGALVFGEPQERSAAYLAANKESNLSPADWQEALKVLEQDGSFERLIRIYGLD